MHVNVIVRGIEMIRWEVVNDKYRNYPQAEIKLPVRSTKFSAGYDICTPVDITIWKDQTIKVKTDLKCKMSHDLVMLVFPRSSVGIKEGVMLTNTVGVIDADFFENEENDGNITLALTKISGGVSKFKAGDKIAQAVFVKYHTDGKEVDQIRQGGIGSTNE